MASFVDLINNEFSKLAAQTIKELYDDKLYCDVSLVSGSGEKVDAHKFILASSSITFTKILEENHNPNMTIFMKDVESRVLSLLIEYIYIGQVVVPHMYLDTFLKIGRDLKIVGLNNKPAPKVIDEQALKRQTMQIVLLEILIVGMMKI